MPQFCKWCEKNGNEVIEIFTNDKKINYCKACAYCESHNGKCCQDDDMAEIIEEILRSDVLVFAGPVYFYSINGQLKTLIDRLVATYTKITSKEFYYIFTAAGNSSSTFNGTAACMQGLYDCLSGIQVSGIIYAGGVWKKGDINSTKYIQQAYDMGQAV